MHRIQPRSEVGGHPSHQHHARPGILRRSVQGVRGRLSASRIASTKTKKSPWRCGGSRFRRVTKSTSIARWRSRSDWTTPTVWSSTAWRKTRKATPCSLPSSRTARWPSSSRSDRRRSRVWARGRSTASFWRSRRASRTSIPAAMCIAILKYSAEKRTEG